MAFLGIETAKAPTGMRGRRFLAFLIDAAIVIALSFVVYRFTGRPDFFAVQAAMDAAEAAGGQDQAPPPFSPSLTARTACCCSSRSATRR